MKIRTGNGDRGCTHIGNITVRKDSDVIEALGAVDEAISAIGFARSLINNAEIDQRLHNMQKVLRACGTVIYKCASGVSGNYMQKNIDILTNEVIRFAETQIDAQGFIFPGTNGKEHAALDMARCAVRRAERRLAALADCKHMSELMPAINAMSDAIFIMMNICESEKLKAGGE